MANSASQVQIVNMALLKFGNVSITAITDSTPQARWASVLWAHTLRELIHGYPWKFALKRDTLETPSATAPEFEYDYKYTLPTDCLRVWNIYDMESDEWTVEGGELYCNLSEDVYIHYIADITDVSLFPPAFARCLADKLAADLCSKMAEGGSKYRQALLAEFERDIAQAYKLNAIEGQPARHKDEQDLSKGNFSWQAEGR